MNVSIVNWIKEPEVEPRRFRLDGDEVDSISASLVPEDLDVSAAVRLRPNAGCSFQGPIPVGEGFVLEPNEAERLLALEDADYSDVVRPYLVGKDIAEDSGQQPRRWIIDFGVRPLEEAERWPEAIAIVRERVKPFHDRNKQKRRRERWWQFGSPATEMRGALSELDRYIGGTATGVRLNLCWVDAGVCPSNAMNVFAFGGGCAMGILCSAAHDAWAWGLSSTMRVDLRYTPTSAFETFPWPDPSDKQRTEIGETCKQLFDVRSAICVERQIGLTELYNEIDDGAHRELAELHRKLDRAVVEAYGWPASVAEDRDESNRRLLELNRAIAAGEVEYAGPG